MIMESDLLGLVVADMIMSVTPKSRESAPLDHVVRCKHLFKKPL